MAVISSDSPAQAEGGGRAIPLQGLYWILPALLALGALAVLLVAIFTVAFDWEFFVGESINSFFADRLIDTGVLYDDWGPLEPYFPIYPPGYYLAAAPFQLLDDAAIWQGRLLSLFGFALAGFAAWCIARRLGCSTPERWTSALGFLFISVTGLLVAAARPDGLGLGLIGGALLAATRWEDERRPWDLWLAAGFSAAFVIVKYNFAPIAAGIAVAFWLSERRAAIRFSAVVAGLVLGVFVTIQVLSDGAFGRNTSDFGIGYSMDSLSAVVEGLVLPVPNPLLIVAAIEVGLVVATRSRLRAVHLGWLGSVLVIVSAAKIGASLNYVAPLALASSILAGPALMRARALAGPAVAVAVSAGLALMLLPLVQERARGVAPAHDELEQIDAVNREATDRIAAVQAPVFGDRNDLTIAAGHGPSFDNVPLTLLAANGEWDTAPLISHVRNQDLGLIQSSFDLSGSIPSGGGGLSWPPELVAAARDTYCEAWTTPVRSPTGNGIWLYEPCD